MYLGKLDEKSLDELHILLILYGGSETQNLFLHIGTFFVVNRFVIGCSVFCSGREDTSIKVSIKLFSTNALIVYDEMYDPGDQ